MINVGIKFEILVNHVGLSLRENKWGFFSMYNAFIKNSARVF